MNLRWMAALAATMMVLLAGCGGGTDRTKAQVRLVNASSGYAQLELRVDDEVRQSGVSYGNSASYVEAEPGKSTSIFASGGATALLTFTPSTSERKYYTVLAYGAAGSLKQVTLDENQGEPDANRSLLRVVNAAPDAGSVDVYVTGSNDTLQASVPVQSAVAVDSVGGFITINSGTWRLRVTGAGSKTDLRLDVPSITLGSKGIVTLVITPSPKGVLTRALFLSQQGGITGFAATQARVRVASGLTDTAARLGDTSLLVAGNAPTVSAYSSLSAGDQTLVVTVGSETLSSTVKSLAAGSEYTLLLHGTAGSPQVSWIDDDNTRPTDISQAKVRLINGVSGLSGTATMTVNGAQIGAGVAAGAASDYSLQEASTTADILVAGAGPLTLFSAADQTFLAASNYTVFVLGPSASATGVLRRDR
jgi:Domain of unknown function (DUF4397)